MTTKFNELVTKVIVEGRSSDDIAKCILSWVKGSKPIVVVRKEKNK
tara:strand:- start:53 stop:190 length:138 start_codon:yes stop_codon:yes gene_type:complete